MNKHARNLIVILIFFFYIYANSHASINENSQVRSNEAFNLGSNSENGLKSVRVNDLVYFYQNSSIKVYDLKASQWVDTFVLNQSALAFTVDDSGIFVAQGFDVYHYPFDHGSAQFLATANYVINELILANGYLIIESHFETGGNAEYLSVDKNSGSIIDSMIDQHSNGHVVLDSSNAVYSVSLGSTNRVEYFNVLDSGEMSPRYRNPLIGIFPVNGPVYKYPNESRVIDAIGNVYIDADLSSRFLFDTYAGKLSDFVSSDVATFTHMDFYGDLPIVLYNDILFAYSNDYSLTNSLQLAENKDTFYIHEEQVHLFKYNATNIENESIDISMVTSELPYQGINPDGLAYKPESIFNNGSDNLYLYDRNLLNIFVFDSKSMSYQTGYELDEPPNSLTFSVQNNKIYLSYLDGRVSQLDPQTGVVSEFLQPNTSGSWGPGTIVSFNDKVFLANSSVIEVYDRKGLLLSTGNSPFGGGAGYTWNDVNKKMHYFSNRNVNWLEIDTNGILGEDMQSGYNHTAYWQPPLCISKNGTHLITGNDSRFFEDTTFIYDANSLVRTHELNNDIDLCAWPQNGLFTLNDNNLQFWNNDFTLNNEIVLPYDISDLIMLQSGAFISIHDLNGVLQFTLHNNQIFKNSFESNVSN